MTVSFIIPTHNNAKLLAKTLAGLAAQEAHTLDWEIILVDNNSDDESIASVHRKFRDVLPLKLIQQQQLPHPFALCKARNLGIRLAMGKWIVSIDADTIPNKSYLRILELKIAEWKDVSVIATSERCFISTDRITPRKIINNPSILDLQSPVSSPSNYGLQYDRRLPVMRLLPGIEHPWDYMHGCNVVYKREDALRVGGYREIYDGHWGFEDIDFAYHMIKMGGCLPSYVPGMHVFHQDLHVQKSNIDRYDKSLNPNWARICLRIPGYKNYKIEKYRNVSKDIKV